MHCCVLRIFTEYEIRNLIEQSGWWAAGLNFAGNTFLVATLCVATPLGRSASVFNLAVMLRLPYLRDAERPFCAATQSIAASHSSKI